MNFHSSENQIFKSFGCTKILKNEPKTQNKLKRSNANHNDQAARKANI